MTTRLNDFEKAAARALHLAAVQRGDVNADVPIEDFADDARATTAAVLEAVIDMAENGNRVTFHVAGADPNDPYVQGMNAMVRRLHLFAESASTSKES